MGLTRRQYLTGVVSVGAGSIAATAATAHEQGSLDATVRVQGDAVDGTGDVGHLWLTISNDRPADGKSIEPVVQCWAMERQTQLAWTIKRGETPIPPVVAGWIETAKDYRKAKPTASIIEVGTTRSLQRMVKRVVERVDSNWADEEVRIRDAAGGGA